MPARSALERAGNVLIAGLIFSGCFVSFKPAPYEFFAIAAMVVWSMIGLRPHRSIVVLGMLLFAWRFGVLVALFPYVDEPDSVSWAMQSVYLALTALFFAAFLSEETERRMELALKAFVASCLLASAGGILSYFVESRFLFATYGRASGFFPDPNVFGSYQILGVVYLARKLFTGETRRPLLVAICLGVIAAGVFLAFSRGSWGATVVGIALMGWLTFRTSAGRIRRRIVAIAAGTILGGVLGVAALLSVGSVAERFSDRAQVTQDYDEGESGRFGNQIRSIPMLVERPIGFGPLRFYLTFGLDPHNSYIGGFANGGWLGGLGFIGLVIVTTIVGFRLCASPSPFQRLAFVVCPALLMFFLQAFQIDIDPWRHVYLMIGMVWGLEAARIRWQFGQRQPSFRGAEGEPGTHER